LAAVPPAFRLCANVNRVHVCFLRVWRKNRVGLPLLLGDGFAFVCVSHFVLNESMFCAPLQHPRWSTARVCLWPRVLQWRLALVCVWCFRGRVEASLLLL